MISSPTWSLPILTKLETANDHVGLLIVHVRAIIMSLPRKPCYIFTSYSLKSISLYKLDHDEIIVLDFHDRT